MQHAAAYLTNRLHGKEISRVSPRTIAFRQRLRKGLRVIKRNEWSLCRLGSSVEGMAPRYSYKIGHNKQRCQRKHALDLFSYIYYWENNNFLDNCSSQETLLLIDSTDNRQFLQSIQFSHASFTLLLVIAQHSLMQC